MATIENHQTLVPYEPTKDCSMGFCSIYCHHWCYLIFPPPPPIILSVDDEHSRRTFSPLVIAVVGILASAFLLVSYYAIISKYCGTCNSLWRLQLHGSDADEDGHELHGNLGQSSRGEALHVSPPRGLDQALIDKIMLCKYKRGGDGLVEGSDCSICLGEFREDESLRLLPKCSHAFHLQCIDTWLKSHSNCPLCRADIVIMNLELPAPPAPVDNVPQVEETIEHNVEMSQLVREDNSVIGGEDEESQLSNNNIVEISPQAHCNLGGILGNNTIVDTRDYEFQTVLRRSSSMGALCCIRDSKIRDVLQVRMGEELAAAEENGFWIAVTSSSTGCREEHVKGRSLHCVTSPVLMKRSFSSSGRFFFSRHGRGRNAILPM